MRQKARMSSESILIQTPWWLHGDQAPTFVIDGLDQLVCITLSIMECFKLFLFLY